MSPDKRTVARELVAAAMEFHRVQPWKFVRADRPIALELGGGTLFAFLWSEAAREPRLMIWRGSEALRHLYDAHQNGGPNAETVASADVLSAGISRLREIPTERRRILKEAGLEPRREDLAPWFLVKRPGHSLRNPDAEERQILLSALRAILAVNARGELRPPDGAFEAMLTLIVKGSGAGAEVATELRTYAEPPEPAYFHVATSDPGLSALPQLPSDWVVAWPELPAQLRGDPRSASAILVVDISKNDPLVARAMLGRDSQEAGRHLLDVMRGESESGHTGRPRRVKFMDRGLLRAMASVLEPAGVACEFAGYEPRLRRLMEDLGAEMFRRVGNEAEGEHAPS